MRILQGLLALAVAATACSKARPRQGEPVNPVSWEQDIAPLYAQQCNSCHSGPNAPLGYRTTSYLEALGPTSAPVARAGDPASRLLQKIDPAVADAVHAPVSGAFDQSRAWVVDGQLSVSRTGVHEGGILNPHDPEFHSNLVREQNFNFSLCQGCHGTDLAGGKAGVSCQDCHSLHVAADGSTTCSSCHGSAQSIAPPPDLSGNTSSSALGVGAHQAHVIGKTLISAPIPCGSCHVVPADVAAPTHIDGLRPAEVTFSGLAVTDAAAPKWDHATASCSGAYCHGGGASLSRDTSAQVKAPIWTQGTSQAFCGACHGIPPSTPPHSPSFSLSSCAGCHPKTVTAQGNIIISGPPEARTSFHINGVVNAP